MTRVPSDVIPLVGRKNEDLLDRLAYRRVLIGLGSGMMSKIVECF